MARLIWRASFAMPGFLKFVSVLFWRRAACTARKPPFVHCVMMSLRLLPSFFGLGHLILVVRGSNPILLWNASVGFFGEYDVAHLNIPFAVWIRFAFHVERSWLKPEAPSNIPSMVTTFETSHRFNGRLNPVAFRNICFIFVALETFQELRGRLNMLRSNMPANVVTREVSHSVID